ncbi:MAG: hypothetical protein ABR970_08675 [Roseiarcus sp.]|jgi:hypothetical protein
MSARILAIGAVLLALCAAPAALAQQGGYLNDLRPCPPGTHSESFPSGSGYRCTVDR